jgi:hypothetical protein
MAIKQSLSQNSQLWQSGSKQQINTTIAKLLFMKRLDIFKLPFLHVEAYDMLLGRFVVLLVSTAHIQAQSFG